MVQAVTWERIGGHGHLGSWRNPELRAARALIAAGGALFAGVYGDAPGQAEIWRYQDGAWSRVFSARRAASPSTGSSARPASVTGWSRRGRLEGPWSRRPPGPGSRDGRRLRDPGLPRRRRDCVECLEPLGKNSHRFNQSHGPGRGAAYAGQPLDFREWSPVSQPEPLSGIYSLATFDNGLITGGYRRDGPAVIRRLDMTVARPRRNRATPRIAYDPLPGRLPEAFVVMDGRLMVQFNIHVGLETGDGPGPAARRSGAMTVMQMLAGPGVPYLLRRPIRFSYGRRISIVGPYGKTHTISRAALLARRQ